MLRDVKTLTESGVDQIRGDLCRAHGGRFSSCGAHPEVGLQSTAPTESPAPAAVPVDPALRAKAEKMKTPLSVDDRIQMLQLGASKFPAPKVDPKSIRLRPDRAAYGAIMEWTDTKGSSQRAYATAFLEKNAEKKWARIKEFRPKLAATRAKVRKKIADSKPGSDEHQAATIAGVIAETGLRPGGRADSAEKGHYGISDLRAEHVTINDDGTASLNFVGKAGKVNTAEVRDPTTVGALRQLKDRAGDGPLFSVGPEKARAVLPAGMKLKDLRTIIATETAERALDSIPAPPPPLPGDPEKAKKTIAKLYMDASKTVAARLNNTPAIARAAYIHPEVLNAWVRKVGGQALITASEAG